MARTRERFQAFLEKFIESGEPMAVKSQTFYSTIRDAYERNEGRKTAAEFMMDLTKDLEAERT